MPSYAASQFDPPAPIVRVALRNPKSRAAVDNELLLLDTGADVTLLSRTAVKRLAKREKSLRRSGFSALGRSVPQCCVERVALPRRDAETLCHQLRHLKISQRAARGASAPLGRLRLIRWIVTGHREAQAHQVRPRGEDHVAHPDGELFESLTVLFEEQLDLLEPRDAVPFVATGHDLTHGRRDRTCSCEVQLFNLAR